MQALIRLFLENQSDKGLLCLLVLLSLYALKSKNQNFIWEQ